MANLPSSIWTAPTPYISGLPPRASPSPLSPTPGASFPQNQLRLESRGIFKLGLVFGFGHAISSSHTPSIHAERTTSSATPHLGLVPTCHLLGVYCIPFGLLLPIGARPSKPWPPMYTCSPVAAIRRMSCFCIARSHDPQNSPPALIRPSFPSRFLCSSIAGLSILPSLDVFESPLLGLRLQPA